MSYNLKLEGNFLSITDTSTDGELFRAPLDHATFIVDEGNIFTFERNFGNGVDIKFEDLINDTTGLAFTSIAALKTFLSTNLGVISSGGGGGGGGVTDHTLLSNIGTNTHAQIDTHIANSANPHSVTAAQIGLGAVNNTSDADKPISTATQTALNAKAAMVTLGFEDYWSESNFTQASATQANLVGAQILSGTATTAIPTAGLNGRFPHGVFIRSSTSANGGYRFSTSYLTSDYFGVVTHKLQSIFLWRAFTNITVRLGYLDTATITDSADGAYFDLVGNVVNCKTANNSVRTTVTMATVLSLDVNYAFDIEVNAAGTSAVFKLYNADTNTLLNTETIATNIPTTSARAFGAGIVATESSVTASDIGILKYFGFGTVNGYLRFKG